MVKKTCAWVLILPALLGVLAAGCGGPSQEQKDEAVEAREAADSAAEDAEQAEKDATKAANGFAACSSQVQSFLQTLSAVDSRLDIGLSYDDYSSVVSNAKVVYDRLPFGQMGPGCISTAIPAEKALNSYVDAYNTWNECFSDLYCDVDSVEPELQDDWAKAGRQLRSTRIMLSTLKTNAADAQVDAEKAQERADELEQEAADAEAALD